MINYQPPVQQMMSELEALKEHYPEQAGFVDTFVAGYNVIADEYDATVLASLDGLTMDDEEFETQPNE